MGLHQNIHFDTAPKNCGYEYKKKEIYDNDSGNSPAVLSGRMREGRAARHAASGQGHSGSVNRPAAGRKRGRTDGTVRALTDFINPLPDYLYSGTERITVMADDTLRMNLDVTQRVRDLHIELTVTEGDPERITGITGTLSGVAEAYDLRNETLYGEAVSTRPTFTRDGDKVSADLRLLGVLGDAQTLTLVLTFTDGQTQTVESDLTEVLSGFGEGDMTQTFAIEGGLRTPLEAGFSATITDWEVVDEGKIDVN